MICSKCKCELPDDSDFCHICGNKISTEAAPTIPATNITDKKEIKAKTPMSKKSKKTIVVTSASFVALAVIVILVFTVIIPSNKYNHAQELLELGKYDLAYTAFSELGNYSDAEDKLLETRYLQAVDYRKNEDYDVANKIFEVLGDYRDSKSLIHNHDYKVSASTPKTCTTDGSETHTCATCGHSYVTTIKAEHTYTLVKNTPSTCSSTGEKKYTCSACNHSYTDTIAIKSHSFKSATCTTPKTCSDCGKTEGSALGHSGSIICSRCGEKTFEKLSYTGTGSKVIDYTLPSGKFRVTVTATSGEAIVSAKIYHGNTYEYLSIYDAGNSEIETITGPVSGGTIVVNADDDYFGKSSWKITIEAIGN